MSNAFVIQRRSDSDEYALWRFDPGRADLLEPVPFQRPATLDRRAGLSFIGGYLLTWGPSQRALGAPKGHTGLAPYFNYRLVPFDPAAPDDPLGASALQWGNWAKEKFWGTAVDFGNPEGGHKEFANADTITLLSVGTFLLGFIPTSGRGTFALWNFDPCPMTPGCCDPLPYSFYNRAGSFRDIDLGHELLSFDNYVLDRRRESSEYRVWNVDPQAIIPLAWPPVQAGTWRSIGPDHELAAIGEHLLAWLPATRAFTLYRFDPTAQDPLGAPVAEGKLPAAIGTTSSLFGFEAAPPRATSAATAKGKGPAPGTIEFMRSRIRHVVYYMLENRSFDHVLGWLHEKGEKDLHVIGPRGPFDGASTKYWNLDGERKVYVSKYHGGKPSLDWPLEMFTYDPYHDMSDTLRQMYFTDQGGYAKRGRPDMGGFIWNNSSDQVMQTYTPAQLPVLNGLAREFAVSDAWFSSTPGATDTNRAFALTGSGLQQINNFMSPPQYFDWPDQPHRPSIFKLLWANGIADWRIYNSTVWYEKVFTYQLFLEGQIPTVDKAVEKNLATWVAPIAQFYSDAAAGKLPAFTFLEPVWIGSMGTTSYHPGADLVPGERQLNQIYDALRKGPAWEETLFIVTFDEHGGIHDHVPPPHATNPWPHDQVDGFRYDVLGPRVPAILASPWIEKRTVFRSGTGVAYDHTSILATLLDWFGVPRSRWFLGDRVRGAPTFENVLTRARPRADSPAFTPPHDKNFPPTGPARPSTRVSALHREVAHLAVHSITRGKATAAEVERLSAEVLAAADLATMAARLEALRARFG